LQVIDEAEAPAPEIPAIADAPELEMSIPPSPDVILVLIDASWQPSEVAVLVTVNAFPLPLISIVFVDELIDPTE
jgi:hypothetical protein